MPSADQPATNAKFIQIWDAPVRLFHWLLVALLAFSWWSGEQHDMDWHRLSGYAILTLLIFRVYWGFAGGRTARFAQFLRGPQAMLGYVRSLGARRLGRGRYVATPGHNPVGGWSVILLLATLMTMVVAGLFAVDIDGLESGPLADYVTFDQGRLAAKIHGWVFNLILTLIAAHVAAILLYLVLLRHNLISPMLSGRRRALPGEAVQGLNASLWKAALGIAIAGVVTYAVARGFRF